jgi:HPt (histidine-containing phosphotransfer) domain-containing protein
VEAFQRDSRVRVAALRAAVPGDSQVLMQAAHALKGSAANIGAGGVVAVCAELEELGRSGRPGNGAGLVSRLEAELLRLDAELEAAVKGDQ